MGGTKRRLGAVPKGCSEGGESMENPWKIHGFYGKSMENQWLRMVNIVMNGDSWCFFGDS